MNADPIPQHVDPALVRDWPMKAGLSDIDPYAQIIPRIHAEWPEAVYARGGHFKGDDVWVFRRAAAMREIYIDAERFSATQQTLMSSLIGESWDQIPNEIDPPAHFFYRSLLNPLFTPRAISEMGDKVRAVADDYLDRIVPLGQADFVADFTLRFPIAIFLGLVNFPMEMVDYYLKLEYDLVAGPDLAIKSQAMRTVMRILDDVVTERSARPGDDLFSYMLQAEYRGRRMTRDEVIRTGTTLYLGGLDTVAQVMGWSIRHLARHPEQQALLRANPELFPDAVEELIRAYAVTMTWRRAMEDMDFRGVRLAKGDLVALPTYIAAYDPDEYECPTEVDFKRRNKRNLTFGTGVHNCLGIHLARRELLVALEQIVARCPNFRFLDGEDAQWHLGPVLGLDRMVLKWDV